MQILDFTGVKVGPGPLYGVENYSEHLSLDKLATIKFEIPKGNEFASIVKEEYFIQTDNSLYIIKSITPYDESITVEGTQDVTGLTNKLFPSGFEAITSPLSNMAALAISGTGWTVTTTNVPTFSRTLRLDSTDTLTILREIADKFGVEVLFDSKAKVVKFNSQFGQSRGAYFSDQLNAYKVYKKSDTKEFATKLYARGKDGMTFASINGGNDFITNYTYTTKEVTKLWVDARYTDPESLLADAKARLAIMCKPKMVYELETYDLSGNSDYAFLTYDIGDEVTIINSEFGYRDIQRITEIIRYPEEPHRGSVTLANVSLTLEELSAQTEKSLNKVEEAFNEDGTINVNKLDGFPDMPNDYITAEHIASKAITAEHIAANAIEAAHIKAGSISSGHIQAGTITANSAIIDDASISSAKIIDLNANKVKFGTATGGTLDVQTLLSKFISGDSAQFLNLTTANTTIANAVIKDAMIESINAAKINAGQINTNLVKILSATGNLAITDNTIQIKDATRVRVQIGKDASGDYSIYVWDKLGNLMFDSNGITDKAIKTKIIRDDMVSDTANISGSKLNISSVISKINEDGTTNLKSSKILLDEENQTLEVAFNSLKTDTTEKIQANTTQLELAQGSIRTLITDTQTNTDGLASLEGNYSSLSQTVGGLTTTVGSHGTSINGLTQRVGTAETSITQLNKSIALKVEASDITKAVDAIEVGGRNLVPNSAFLNKATSWTIANGNVDESFLFNAHPSFKVNITGLTSPNYRGAINTNMSKRVFNAQDKIAISFYYYVADATTLDNGFTFEIKGKKVGTTAEIGLGSLGFKQADVVVQKWTKASFVVKFNFDVYDLVSRFYAVQNGTFWITDIKVEEGNKSTEWTPAPEDIDSAISTVDGKVGATNTQVSQLTIDLGGIATRVGAVETKASGTANSLGGITTRVESAESSIKQLNSSIVLKVESKQVTDTVTSAINNVEIGGRNLVRNTGMKTAWATWNNKSTTALLATGTKLTTVSIGQLAMTSPLTLSPSLGSTYTITFKARGNLPVLEVYFLATSGSNIRAYYNASGATALSATEFRQLSATITLPTTPAATYGNLFIGGTATVVGQWLEVAKDSVKLEKGNKATDWIPAPEDVASDISTVDGKVTETSTKVGKLETSVGGIIGRVDAVETKATGTAGGLADLTVRVSSAEQKITPAAIISTVQNTISNSQAAAINSANSATDVKLQSYATTSAVTQTANALKLDFSSRGGYNLLKNSTFEKGNMDHWGSAIYLEPNKGGAVTDYYATPVTNQWTGNELAIQMHATVVQGSYRIEQYVPTIPGRQYTFSGLIAGHRSDKAVIIRRPDWTWITLQDYAYHIDGGANDADWAKINITFTALDTVTTIVIQQGTSSDGYIWLKRLIVNEGNLPLPWTPHPSEIYSGNTIIDSTGVTVKNGGFKIQNKAGVQVFGADTLGNLSITGDLTSQSLTSERYVALNSGGLTYRDSYKNEEVFRMATTSYAVNRDMNGVSLSLSKYGDFMNFNWIDKVDLVNGWTSDVTSYSFMSFWSNDSTIGTASYKKGVNVFAPAYFRNRIEIVNSGLHSGVIQTSTMNSVTNQLGLYGDNGAILGGRVGDTNVGRFWVKESADSGNDDWINSWGHYNMGAYTLHNVTVKANNLEVSGSKNSLQKTENYGERLINAYETAEYFFGDIGSGTIKDGECIIYIDEIFKECINTSIQYHVFTQAYNGSITQIDRQQEYFIVYGEDGTEFSWELKAKRIGYENNRLDIPTDISCPEAPPFESESDNPIIEEDVEKEIEFNLEDYLLSNDKEEEQ